MTTKVSGEFKSKAQRGLFHAMEERGEMPAKEVEKWERETPKSVKKHLPEHVKKSYDRGAEAALGSFKIAGPMDFLRGQAGAAKDLLQNVRGGLGGAPHPSVAHMGPLAEGVSGPAVDLGELQRQRAMGNVRTLLPSLAAGGGMYLLHRHNQAKREAEQSQAQQQAMMMQQLYGQPGGL